MAAELLVLRDRAARGRRVLVDAGVGPAERPGAPWCPVPGRLPEALAEAGIAPADVESVVLTHLHEDHVGWSTTAAGDPLFPRARYIVQHAETAALDRSDPLWQWVVEPLRATGQLDEVRGEHRLGRVVTFLPTPGHTPGHQSVLVEQSDGRGVVVHRTVGTRQALTPRPGPGGGRR
ncbi:MBL fold metallo-hydrolase [Streptomyces sp. NPDC060022]|uniref:MBL fold metallo-hydrolase n=1 Tax=Streptomyces sp. NPDC060022 TaxID=3347039 RepID=UPI003682593F